MWFCAVIGGRQDLIPAKPPSMMINIRVKAQQTFGLELLETMKPCRAD